jgi:hypothetical protein
MVRGFRKRRAITERAQAYVSRTVKQLMAMDLLRPARPLTPEEWYQLAVHAWVDGHREGRKSARSHDGPAEG